MPNVMAALPNIGGNLCATPQSWLTPTTTVPCSNAAKTRNPWKFAGVPQTNEPISAVGVPKFTILSGHAEEVLEIFPIVDTCLSCDKIVRWCRDGDFLAIFASCIFSEPRAARFRSAF